MPKLMPPFTPGEKQPTLAYVNDFLILLQDIRSMQDYIGGENREEFDSRTYHLAVAEYHRRIIRHRLRRTILREGNVTHGST
jgi:hypothetical protein